jgi:hypothetical protein
MPVAARYLARLVSAYERAPVRDIMALGIFAVVEGAATDAVMRAALYLTGAPLAPTDDETSPGSGWRGTTVALAIWLLPFAIVALAVRG